MFSFPKMFNHQENDFSVDDTDDPVKRRKGRQLAMQLEREYWEFTKERQEEIVTELLKKFNLEETMDKYRGRVRVEDNSSTRYTAWSAAGQHAGSGGYISDQMKKASLDKAIQDDHERHLNRKEGLLAEAEVRRIRTLQLRGLIPFGSVTAADTCLTETVPRKRSRQFAAHVNRRNKQGHKYRSKPSVQESARQKQKPVPPSSRQPYDLVAADRKSQLPSNVEALYVEETVVGLYSMADKIVRRGGKTKGHPV